MSWSRSITDRQTQCPSAPSHACHQCSIACAGLLRSQRLRAASMGDKAAQFADRYVRTFSTRPDEVKAKLRIGALELSGRVGDDNCECGRTLAWRRWLARALPSRRASITRAWLFALPARVGVRSGSLVRARDGCCCDSVGSHSERPAHNLAHSDVAAGRRSCDHRMRSGGARPRPHRGCCLVALVPCA